MLPRQFEEEYFASRAWSRIGSFVKFISFLSKRGIAADPDPPVPSGPVIRTHDPMRSVNEV